MKLELVLDTLIPNEPGIIEVVTHWNSMFIVGLWPVRAKNEKDKV